MAIGAMNHDSAEHMEHAIRSRFPCVHNGAFFSNSDGSTKKVDGGARDNQDAHEVAGTYTGTGLVTAGTQQVLRIDPNGKGMILSAAATKYSVSNGQVAVCRFRTLS